MQINFYLNKSCDQNCYYCNQGDRSKYKVKTDDELLRSFVNAIDAAKQVCPEKEPISIGVLGGEPGVWSEYLWTGILTTVKKYNLPLCVLTNGAIFNHPSFKQDIPNTTFFWHCSLDLDPVKIPEIKREINHQIVVTHENLHKLDEFLTINENTIIAPDVVQSSLYKENTPFTEQDWDTLVAVLSKHKNIDELRYRSIIATRDNIKEGKISMMQDLCKKQRLNLIDISEDVIYRCCTCTDQLPLTEQNLKDHYNNILFKQANCGSCFNHIFYYFESLNNQK